MPRPVERRSRRRTCHDCLSIVSEFSEAGRAGFVTGEPGAADQWTVVAANRDARRKIRKKNTPAAASANRRGGNNLRAGGLGPSERRAEPAGSLIVYVRLTVTVFNSV